MFIIFALRLWYLQIFSGTELREFSEKNRIKQNKIAAPRGLMLDRDGQVLVENLPGFEAVLSPQYIENLEDLAHKVAPLIGSEPKKLISKVERSRRVNGRFAIVKLKEGLSREEVLRLKRIRLDTPGLEIRESILRAYPLHQNGAQLFGYVSEISKSQLTAMNELYKGEFTFNQGDIIGKSGLEEILERDIRGQDGMSFIQVDARGRETITQTPNVYGEQIKDLSPIYGHSAVLTIDRDIQEAAYQSMLNHKRMGAIVAMKSNGEVLAWVSGPSFDPNEFATGVSSTTWSTLINDPYKPLRNKVIQDHNAPGSTYKPFIALAALQEKIITPQTIVQSPGVYMFGRRPYHDHQKGGHGNINVIEAIERSANVFFFKMGISLGVDKMHAYATALGLGAKTGVELKREVAGTVPSSEWKKATLGEEWQPGENLSTAIGQGFVVVTPLQMAVAYNAIATEGKVVKPMIVQKIIDQDGQVLKEFFPQVVRDLQQTQPNGLRISAEAFKTVKEGMRRVANGERGTARYHKVPGIEMAGKTGTAQVIGFSADQIYTKCDTRPMHLRHHGWFVAFAPAINPEITVAVFSEHGCSGSGGAAPIARDIMEAYFTKHYPELVAQAKAKKPNRTSSTPPPPQPQASEVE